LKRRRARGSRLPRADQSARLRPPFFVRLAAAFVLRVSW
jgi:hypothetical protein